MRHLTNVTPALVIVLMLTASVQAQQFPSQQRGLNADTAYQIGDIDHINLFNGNLSLTVPIGQSYPVGPNLSFQLSLVYSSNGWDHEKAVCTDQDGTHRYSIPIQEPQTNAGFGWRIQPGKLGVERYAPSPFSSRSYFSPDGGEIFFTEELHPGYGNQANTWFSTDGTYLRMRYQTSGCTGSVGGSSACYQIDFPGGTIHEFHDFSPAGSLPEDRDWRVTRMFDRFTTDHHIKFDYSAAGEWRITDSHDRRHTVFLTGDLITKVELASFGGAKATYELVHTPTAIDRHRFFPPNCDTATDTTITASMLTEFKQPENTSYTMAYETQSSSTLLSGGIESLRLPTGGRYDWTYTLIDFVSQVPNAPGDEEHANTSFGVSSKKTYTASTLIGEWTYKYFTVLDPPSLGSSPFESAGNPTDGTPGSQQLCYHTVTVTDPVGNDTVHYFDSLSSNRWQYGLPIKRCDTITGNPTLAPPFLSHEEYEGLSDGTGTKMRSVYVEYGSDGRDGGPGQAKNHRLTARVTVYHDDGDKTRKQDFEEFDGLGHFRKVTTSGDFVGSETRTATTGYNGTNVLVINPDDSSYGAGNNFVLPDRSAPWVLNTFDKRTVEHGGDTATTEACFDTDTGFLKRQRTLKGANRSGQDLLVDFEEGAGGTGRVALVRTYGGDAGSLGTGALCGVALTTSDAETQNVLRYEFGALKSSDFLDCDDAVILKASDFTLDKNTGKVKTSRDSSGVATTFVYDKLGRQTQEQPTGGAWIKTTYMLPVAPSTAAPQLKVERFANGSTSGALLSETKYLYDGIGRLRRQTISYPDSSGVGGSTRDFTYDGLGRRIKQSMWEDFTLTQDATFDRFGRVTKLEPADSDLAATIIKYTGGRLIDRTTKVATEEDGGESWVCAREEYDALGRLVKVSENRSSDAQGACAGTGFNTFYSYDEADRLTRVCAGGGDPCGQERFFSYDNRGFLTSEKHPEIGPSGKGTVSYAYDARGNVLAKDVAGTADFDLRYRYDEANRLVGIDQATGPGVGDRRPLKSFHYARTNDGTDKRAGKLVRATRTNYVDLVDPISNVPGTIPVAVSQAYHYQGLDGRVSQRQTRYTFGAFHFTFDTGFDYDSLGNVSALEYPKCLNAAECPPGEAPDRTVTFDYVRGFLSGVPGYATRLSYQLGGMLKSIEHANNVTETLTHADSNLPRLKRIQTTGVTSGNWDTEDYVYDGAGNIKATGTQSYRYDRLNRMVRGELDTGAPANKVQEAAYDAYGNLISLETAGVTRATPVTDGTNRLSDGSYDAGGNLTGMSHGTEQYEYTYDPFNMMTSLRSNTDQARIFIYDADDQRFVTFDCALVQCDQRSRTTYTLRDLGGRVLRVFEDLPSEPFAWKHDYIYRNGQLLASVQPHPTGGPEQTRHLHLDHLAGRGKKASVAGDGLVSRS